MTLLFQAIQEYLTEHHPNWLVAQSIHNSIQFIEYKTNPHNFYFVINNTHQTMIYSQITHIDHTKYTEHTLLQQLTNAINQAEKQIDLIENHKYNEPIIKNC